MTQKIKSPRGTLEWITIDGEGKANMSGKMQYTANVVIEADHPIIKEIEAYWKENKPSGVKKAKSLGIYEHTKLVVDEAGEPVLDEDGDKQYEPTGKMYLSFKTGTTFKDGKAKVVQIFNAKGNKVKLPEGTKIGNGSEGIIGGSMGIYEVKDNKGKVNAAGVTLYLNSIQLVKLVEFAAEDSYEAIDDEDAWTGEEFVGDEDDSPSDETAGKVRL